MSSAIVIGGGPAGALAAIRLARAGVRVSLVHSTRRAHRMAETLAPRARATLSTAGLWERRPSAALTECAGFLRAWETDSVISSSFAFNPYGNAWHVNREAFDEWLRAEARIAGARVIDGVGVEAVRTGGSWSVRFRLDAGYSSVVADYLVFAARFRLRSVPAQRVVLDRVAVIGGFADRSDRNTTSLLVEATPTGWWYSAPTPDGALFAGFVTAVEDVRGARAVTRALTALSQAPLTHARVRTLALQSTTAAVSAVLRPSLGDGWIAVGDAAFSRDPLSGDGVASALASGWSGAGALLDLLGGDSTAWDRERARRHLELERYARTWSAAYTEQRRWAKESFWLQRSAAANAALQAAREHG